MTDIPILGRKPKTQKVRLCRGCGCDDDHACITEQGPCAWVLLDVAIRASTPVLVQQLPTGICSACAVEMGWDPQVLAAALCGEVAEVLARGGFLGPEARQEFEQEDRQRREARP